MMSSVLEYLQHPCYLTGDTNLNKISQDHGEKGAMVFFIKIML